MAEKTAIAEKQIVVFALGDETYGVDISSVREIIQMQAITKIPGSVHSVEGVINLRGSVIPVVDLRTRFRMDKSPYTGDTRIVVVNSRGRDVGIIVDLVDEVLRISMDTIEPTTDLLAGERSKSLSGIVKMADRLIILLDLDEVLSKESMNDLIEEAKETDDSEKLQAS